MNFFKSMILTAAIAAGFILGGASMLNAAETQYQLSTHILDIGQGHPAGNVVVELSRRTVDGDQEKWQVIDRGTTDANGRIKTFLAQEAGKDTTGVYKLKFLTQPYFESKKQESFYPYIEVVFQINDNNHYHVPITLSNFGYSTYRGS